MFQKNIPDLIDCGTFTVAVIFFISTNIHKSVRKIISFSNFTVMTRTNDILNFLTVSTYPEYRPIAAEAGMLTVK